MFVDVAPGLFELADLWVDGLDAGLYAAWLWELYRNVAEGDPPCWREEVTFSAALAPLDNDQEEEEEQTQAVVGPGRKQKADTAKQRKKAAKQIQSGARGRKSRQERAKREKAATKVQAGRRGQLERREQGKKKASEAPKLSEGRTRKPYEGGGATQKTRVNENLAFGSNVARWQEGEVVLEGPQSLDLTSWGGSMGADGGRGWGAGAGGNARSGPASPGVAFSPAPQDGGCSGDAVPGGVTSSQPRHPRQRRASSVGSRSKPSFSEPSTPPSRGGQLPSLPPHTGQGGPQGGPQGDELGDAMAASACSPSSWTGGGARMKSVQEGCQASPAMLSASWGGAPALPSSWGAARTGLWDRSGRSPRPHRMELEPLMNQVTSPHGGALAAELDPLTPRSRPQMEQHVWPRMSARDEPVLTAWRRWLISAEGRDAHRSVHKSPRAVQMQQRLFDPIPPPPPVIRRELRACLLAWGAGCRCPACRSRPGTAPSISAFE